MSYLARIATLSLLLALSACAGLGKPPPMPGDSADAVRARLGAPTNIYPTDGGQVWEYAHGPMGQTTDMARFGADGRLLGFEQVLNTETFGTIKVNKSTKQDVLRTVGRPAEKSYLALRDLDVWSYRYKENGVWNSMMHVHFDRNGVVRQMMNGPDPMYDERRGHRP